MISTGSNGIPWRDGNPTAVYRGWAGKEIGQVAVVMIGIDSHKGPHTAVPIGQAGKALGEPRVTGRT